ncbi:hypothetical protein [Streptosporangium roseum]|uniref:hypothetical protein n=1 Tax=Streptosporangium roseum TaxID=2001 RepID=UPI00331B8EF2
MLPTALLIGGAAWATTEWLLQDLDKLPIAEQISTRIEAARTALAAAAGVGAAVTLMLAVRRQRHQELATAHTTHDAAERRSPSCTPRRSSSSATIRPQFGSAACMPWNVWPRTPRRCARRSWT